MWARLSDHEAPGLSWHRGPLLIGGMGKVAADLPGALITRILLTHF
jgi:hypothetical protein